MPLYVVVCVTRTQAIPIYQSRFKFKAERNYKRLKNTMETQDGAYVIEFIKI